MNIEKLAGKLFLSAVICAVPCILGLAALPPGKRGAAGGGAGICASVALLSALMGIWGEP